jgi:hypothetical protein
MNSKAQINGCHVRTTKTIASIVNTRVTFTDGSWCDVATGKQVNKGSSKIVLDPPPRGSKRTATAQRAGCAKKRKASTKQPALGHWSSGCVIVQSGGGSIAMGPGAIAGGVGSCVITGRVTFRSRKGG